MTEFKKSYLQELENNGLVTSEYCSDEENEKYSNMNEDQIPDNVYQPVESTDYQRYESDLTDEEKKLYLLAKQNSNLKIIKGCVIFFVVLAIIGIIVGCVAGYQLYDAIHSIGSTSSLY